MQPTTCSLCPKSIVPSRNKSGMCGRCYTSTWTKENRDYCTQKAKEWRQKNPSKSIEYNRRNYAKHRAKRIASKTEKYRTNTLFRIRQNLRNRLNYAIKRGYKAGSAVSLLGCSVSELKQHLESKFQPGMTWENWAIDGWHLDHIVPLQNFDLTKKEDLEKACHYTNLQPLWAHDNIKKGCKNE